MKEIKAYLHRNRVADVIAALKASPAWSAAGQVGRPNLAVYLVKGSLTPLGDDERHYSLELGDEVVNEYKIELVCDDNVADELVGAISSAARTGQPGAGWVTVTDLVRALRIA